MREERSKAWRTRVVDHMTEIFQNLAIFPMEKVNHDTVDSLVPILVLSLMAGITPLMWKRDISKAFRRIPIRVAHLDLSWVAFLFAGIAWAVQHVGMPFGSTAAVYAWHRMGAFLLCAVLLGKLHSCC